MKLYSIIPERLFTRGSFKKLPLEHKRDILSQNRITTVICTVHSHADPDLSNLSSLEYLIKPLPDGARVPEEAALEIVNLILCRIRLRQRVLVHCIAGRNRSGLIATLVLRSWFNLDGKTALSRLRTVRPGAVANPVFETYLEGLPKP